MNSQRNSPEILQKEKRISIILIFLNFQVISSHPLLKRYGIPSQMLCIKFFQNFETQLITVCISIDSKAFSTNLLFSSCILAHGWFVTDFDQPIVCSGNCKTPPIKHMIFHTGTQIGVSTALALFPEQEYVIVVLTNLGFNKNILDILLNIATNFA
jgi:hypothetical protein